MTNYNVKEIEDLIKLISKLPGLGPKSAKRIVLKLINNKEELTKPLVNTLAQLYKNIMRCNDCGNFKSSNNKCDCSSRKYDKICVVENIADMWAIQDSGIYKGYYHILGGTLPTLESKKKGQIFSKWNCLCIENKKKLKNYVLKIHVCASYLKYNHRRTYLEIPLCM